jgi:CubicO group peptidase (beta-lactamase class C family)
MMRMRSIFLVVLMLVTACAGPEARVRVGFDATTLISIQATGFADRATKRRVTADDPVRVASITKLVVALGVMRMVEAGALDLDRDASDYLGWRLRNPGFPDAKVTLRMLLSHTAGVRDANDYRVWARQFKPRLPIQRRGKRGTRRVHISLIQTSTSRSSAVRWKKYRASASMV